MTTPGPRTVTPGRSPRWALVGIGVGHALEWYDWGVYAIFVPFFATQFFDPADDVSAVPMMTLTVGGMAAASLVIGLSPTFASIGVGASVILLLARVVQGMSTGGELPSAQTYLAETAQPARRGMWSSVIYVASVGGNTVDCSPRPRPSPPRPVTRPPGRRYGRRSAGTAGRLCRWWA